ncbi:hypothetical protein A6V39_00240 [Candidatus Mycoplasma haematobovis]|uniref:Uncharacterized protein n=1 Tax=Candidatus Mycoplasma haematobovis TaxID=432608 RepID=A0A1A9QDZ4_9MOLU|nr:hypothetical protein [Candidatus Mycoplasma haematobovis]OAL10478.1 hypothetical protein A6V39_00240 [Candidatus Mycoplasma haematobovis]
MALNIKNIALIGGGASAIAGGSAGTYYLLQDKTIEHKLIREGEKIIEKDNEYLVAFKEHKSDSNFINLIKENDNSISATGDVNKGKAALKIWCESNLKLDLSKENIEKSFEKVKKYCIKPPMTIGARIEKLGKKWVDNWKNKLSALKQPRIDEGLATDLGKQDSNIIANDLRDWCKGNSEKDLSDQTTDAIWTKVERRCIEPKPVSQG